MMMWREIMVIFWLWQQVLSLLKLAAQSTGRCTKKFLFYRQVAVLAGTYVYLILELKLSYHQATKSDYARSLKECKFLPQI